MVEILEINNDHINCTIRFMYSTFMLLKYEYLVWKNTLPMFFIIIYESGFMAYFIVGRFYHLDFTFIFINTWLSRDKKQNIFIFTGFHPSRFDEPKQFKFK